MESWTAALNPGVETTRPSRKSRAARAAHPETTARRGRGGIVFVIVGLGLLLFLLSRYIPHQTGGSRVPVYVPAVPPPPVVSAEKKNLKDGAEMLWIPAGQFLMGSTENDKDAGSDEKPQHMVSLDGYWMYKNDVTVAQYRTFCQATRRQMPDAPSWGWRDDHPMVNVTWDDANAYAEWAGASLPTEAEWEKAARGTDGRIYPWGNDWDASKCSNSTGSNDSPGQISPVGSFPAGVSPYGCLDMAGNVDQWCEDLVCWGLLQAFPLTQSNWTGNGFSAGTARRLLEQCLFGGPPCLHPGQRQSDEPGLRHWIPLCYAFARTAWRP